MTLHLLLLASFFIIGGGQDVNYNTLSGFGPYLIDYSSKELADVLPLAEMKLRAGGDFTLNDDELAVEKYMRQLRNQILVQHNADGSLYKFLDYEQINLMRGTVLYNLFRDMPKGGNVHLHLKLSGNYTLLLEHLWDNYRNRLYVNIMTSQLTFKNITGWKLLKKFAEDEIGGSCKEDYDSIACRTIALQYFLEKCTFGPGVQNDLNKNGIPNAWLQFEQRYNVVADVLDCINITEWYVANLIVSASGFENIDYLELRTSVNKLYAIYDGTNEGQAIELNDIKSQLIAYKKGLDEGNRILKSLNKSAIDATLIPNGRKNMDHAAITKSINEAKEAWNYWKTEQTDMNNNIIRTLGYDLVGEEDIGYSWSYQNIQSNIFDEAKRAGQQCPIHAGETNWGTNLNRAVESSHVPDDINAFSPDKNLLTVIEYSDVVRRIGHGLALAQHPLWIEAMRARGQCVVVMTLSNQMLQYVQDLRRHPLSTMINSGLRVALSIDDPAMYQVNFSDEFFAAFISANLDVAALKAMIRNSYDCSLLSQSEKDEKIKAWTDKWNGFIARNAPVARSYDPCANITAGDCYKVWNEVDNSKFESYKSFHSVNSKEKISSEKTIDCGTGKKFVIPQAVCITINASSSAGTLKASHLHLRKGFAPPILFIILAINY